MKWERGRRSTNVDDRRGRGVSRGVMVGGGGLGTIAIALLITLLGGDPGVVFQQPTQSPPVTTSEPRPAEEDELADFVSVVLADTEDTWNSLFQQKFDADYPEPTLVLFTGQVDSACGFAQAAIGPFYCPADQKVYIDLSFYDELRTRYQAPGDFAQAYVIAHEVGHHVQNVLGILGQVQELQQQVGQTQANELSVRLELQADCLAGVWAHHAEESRDILERGDIEEALNAASAVGDDRLQMQSRGYVTPDSFTHGTSEQRVRWFSTGIQTGEFNQCNTFEAANL
ncbi:zinc metallopeptidase [Oscillatoria sp. CS-180]|uniref:KPN_02809 family neutral zinc metallopeptidase n=1 Tax=Oscillatoria sp. CS-180 TaxID=3021720 RepID=UPI00232CD427|nr:neutral zinc metallopeptidase [Oscillatoria sp. CS-180]MDB9527369.1 zinc metallopeptidase [Oscillatoria sp. CS-180]